MASFSTLTLLENAASNMPLLQLVQTFNLVLVGLVCHDIELASTPTWNLAKKGKMFLGLGKFVKN